MKNSMIRTLGRGCVSVAFALALGAAASGCIGSISGQLVGSSAASLHFQATVTTPGGPWGSDGPIQVCYKFTVIGGSDLEGCEPYTMQVPGVINMDKDITSWRDAHGITTAQSTWLIINGQTYPGTILSTDVSHRNINGTRDSLISVSAYYQLPGTLASNMHFSSPLDTAHAAIAFLDGRRPVGLPASASDAHAPGTDGVSVNGGSVTTGSASGEASI